MKISRIMAGTGFALALCAVVAFSTATLLAAPGLKGIICHAAGGKYVGIEVSVGSNTDPDPGLISNNGHLDANGNPLSGHEQDLYLGVGATKGDCAKLGPPPDPK